MSLLDILNQYTGQALPGPDTNAHFDQAVQQSSPSDLGGAIAAMLHSNATPAFGQTMGQLFNQSNPLQQAGLLNQILQTIGPGALGAAGGILGSILGTTPAAATAAGSVPTITPAQASQLSPQQVQDIATHAEQHNPSIVDQAAAFYAQHPTLVKSLGAAALAIGLGHLRSNQN
jgi:hypothetical protein